MRGWAFLRQVREVQPVQLGQRIVEDGDVRIGFLRQLKRAHGRSEASPITW